MSEIVDVISKLRIDATEVYTELDKVNSKYAKSNEELRKTEDELQRLIKKEGDLLAARSKASNPTAELKYKDAIDQTRKSIEVTTNAIKSLTAETKKYEAEANKIASATKKAFEGTKKTAINSEFLAIAGGLGVATGVGGIISSLKELGNESVDLAAKAEGIQTAFSHIGGEETLEKLRKATRGAVSDLQLMQAALRAKNFNIPTDLLAKGLEFAGKVARTTGQDVNYLTDSFVDGLGRKSLRILDNLQLSQVELQKEIKKTGDFMQAVGNVLDRKLAETGVVVETSADKLARYTSWWENLKEALGEGLISAIDDLQKALTSLFTSTTFDEVITDKALELQNKQLKKFNGNVLDEAKKSENERLRLILESDSRLETFRKEVSATFTKEEEKKLQEAHKTATGFEKIEISQQLSRIDRLKNRTTAEFKESQLLYQNEKILNDDLRKLGQKRTEDLSDETIKRLRKERKFLEDLEIDIRKAQSVFRETQSSNSPDIKEIDKIEARFIELSIQKNIDFERRRKNIQEEIKDETVKTKALIQLKHLENIELNTLDNDRLAAIRQQKLKEASIEIEGAKNVAELDLKIQQTLTTFSLDQTDERIATIVDYTRKKMDLMVQEGKDEIEILKFSRDQALAIEQIRKDELLRLKKQESEEFQELERFTLANLEYKRRIHHSQITTQEIKFEEERLKRLKDDYDEQVRLTGKQDNERLLEIEKQENNITLLKKRQRKEERQEIIDQTIFIIDNIDKITQATIDGARQIISAEQEKNDKLISLQEKRVAEVEKIAENGNAKLLELEKDRLDKLNKEKEKFVRQQQALATIELISNTAVTVSKAAAEGGAGAAFTIAAALIALVAGLASARSIAGQAAFYSGGEFEGYTGSGNPREESSAVGTKPYVYHKREFIFNHEKTDKFIDVFRKVHKGELDLNQMKFESDMYKYLRAQGISMAPSQHSTGVQSIVDLSELRSDMKEVRDAIKGQSRLKVNIDKNGISIIATEYMKQKKRIDSIAR